MCRVFPSPCNLYEANGEQALTDDFKHLQVDISSFDYYNRLDGLWGENEKIAVAATGVDIRGVPLLDVCVELLGKASKCGIDISVWFTNFDSQGLGTLSQETFQNAFSGLLLGLCAAKPGKSQKANTY